ncbi:MAG: hypothetical protein V2A73_06775 [Pseudomonadota bacterium]
MQTTEANPVVSLTSDLVMIHCPRCQRGHVVLFDDERGKTTEPRCDNCRRAFEVTVTIRERAG